MTDLEHYGKAADKYGGDLNLGDILGSLNVQAIKL